MRGHWKVHDPDGKVRTGTGAPPEGADFHWVTTSGSLSMVNDVLYIDGQQAPTGEHVIDLGEEELPIEVDSNGKAHRQPKHSKGGGQGNGDKETGGTHNPGAA